MVEKQIETLRLAPAACAEVAAGSRARFPGISSRAYEHGRERAPFCPRPRARARPVRSCPLQTMARVIATVGADALPSVAGLAVSVVEAALNDWHRKSELSCDRAGLLVAQDTDASMSALAKLTAGSRAHDINIEELLEQAAEFEPDATGIKSRIYKYLLPSDSHPILVVRASELDRWVRRGEYGRIANDGEYPSRDDDADARVGRTLRNQVTAAKESRLQKAADRYQRLQEKKALSSEHRLGPGE